jgi:hypothetical protein
MELCCSYCRLPLKVDESYAGKKLRCPQCNSLTVVPIVDPDAASQSRRSSDFRDAINPSPGGSTDKHPTLLADHKLETRRSQVVNHADLLSLTLGALGLLLTFSCFWPASLVINLYGLYLGISRRSPLQMLNTFLNYVGLGLAIARMLIRII